MKNRVLIRVLLAGGLILTSLPCLAATINQVYCETNWCEPQSLGSLSYTNVVVRPGTNICVGWIEAWPEARDGTSSWKSVWSPASTNCPASFVTNNPFFITNWWVLSYPGYSTNQEGAYLGFSPTNCGEGTITFYGTWRNSDPCTGNYIGGGTISNSATFKVVNVDIVQTETNVCACGNAAFTLTNSCDPVSWEISPVVVGGPTVTGGTVTAGTNCGNFTVTARSTANTNCTDSASLTVYAVGDMRPEWWASPVTNQPPTWMVCAVATNALQTNLVVTASPCPGVSHDTNLPPCWTMSGGIQTTNWDGTTNRTQRLVDMTTPGTNVIVATSGSCSSITNVIIVERTTLTLARTNVFVNHDDDNGNGTNDLAEFNGDAGLVVSNENDLVLMTLRVESPARADEEVYLSVEPSWWYYGHVRVWDSPQRGPNPPVLDSDDLDRWTTNWTVGAMPTNLWVEGVDASVDVNDVIFTLQTEYGCAVSTNMTVTLFALDGDGNHDGTVDQGGEDHLLKNKPIGVIVPTNVDDDDGNHVEDNRGADAGRINGADDLSDLAPVILRRLLYGDNNCTVTLTLHSAGNVDGGVNPGDVVRIFSSNSDTNAVPILGPGAETYTLTSSNMSDLRNGDLTFGVEGLEFAGEVQLKAEVKDGSGGLVAEDEILLKASPFILLPGTASAQEFYVSDADTNFVAGLEAAVDAWRVTTVSSASYPDVWVQDQVEIGYTHWPLGQLQTVWNLPRDRALQRWPTNELLAAGYGHLRKGSTTGEHYGGNIEVTPPVTVGTNEYKLGRAVIGSNSSLKDFIERQNVQTPIIELDVDWLAVGHVDEVVSFVPAGTGFKVLIADTTRAMELLRNLNVETNGTATGGSTNTLVDTLMNWAANEWQDGFLTITSGTNAGTVRQIAGNTANTITIKGAWPAATGAGAQYEMVARSAYRCFFVEGDEDLGVVTTGTGANNSLIDGTKNWTANQWTNGCVRIVAGTGVGQRPERVVSNTVDTLYTESSLGMDATSRYVVAASSKQWRDIGLGRNYAMISAREVVSDPARATANAADQAEIDQARNTIETELGITATDFVFIPTLFDDEAGGVGGRVAWSPGIVNLLVDGSRLVAAKPFAPRHQGSDVFETAVMQALNGFTLYFVDDWETYHIWDGEVHCGTNAKRDAPSGANWWEYSTP